MSHRAHRVPCNPTITNRSIPDLAPTISLRNALIDPLARTDFLPLYANYADSRFEALGGADSFANAVRIIAREQPQDKPIDYDLFRHAVLGVAQAGYNAAYEQVGLQLRDAMNSETTSKFFSRRDEHKPIAPKNQLESVQDAAYDLLRFSKLTISDLVNRAAFQTEVGRQMRLASGKDAYSVPLR
ncbi:MAG TPA: hypothetical protein VF283_07455 [Bryobacteraceae bacterium]